VFIYAVVYRHTHTHNCGNDMCMFIFNFIKDGTCRKVLSRRRCCFSLKSIAPPSRAGCVLIPLISPWQNDVKWGLHDTSVLIFSYPVHSPCCAHVLYKVFIRLIWAKTILIACYSIWGEISSVIYFPCNLIFYGHRQPSKKSNIVTLFSYF
jgi:hypothetical protein